MAYKSGVCKMNADKLLEDLREIDLFNVDSVNYGNKKHYIDQLESMLRQQQAEIEALKLHNKKLQWALAQQTNLLGVEK